MVKRLYAAKGRGLAPAKIGAVLGHSFSNLGLATRINEFKIKKHWPEVVGRAISQRAVPLRLVSSTLHVTVSSSAWMNELLYHKDEIIEKINSLIGAGAVSNIIFKTGRVEAAPQERAAIKRRSLSRAERAFIDRTVSTVKDQALREAIRRAMEKGMSRDE